MKVSVSESDVGMNLEKHSFVWFDDLRSSDKRRSSSETVTLYESSKMKPEVIGHLDFECEKASIHYLTPHCKNTNFCWTFLHMHAQKSEEN